MSTRNRLLWTAFCLTGILFMATVAQAQEMPAQPGTNMAAMKFVNIPPLPTCARASVASGDPTKGPSIILAKATAGCIIPWHWHTPNEHVMIVSGAATLQMKDAKAISLQAGAFSLMPSHHVHQFRCLRTCALYIYSDVAFDIHYVDKQGNEISPAAATKAVKEKAATEMK
ncbi:MAG TPA: cupin domain-containing protein [Pyrinomonadaceae bacterium]